MDMKLRAPAATFRFVVLVLVFLAFVLSATSLQTAKAAPIPDGTPVLLFDDFIDPALLGWAIMAEAADASAADWQIFGGLLEHSNLACEPGNTLADRPGSYVLYDDGAAWADYAVETLVSSDDDGFVGVIFRWQDEDNYYRFSWKRGQPVRLLVKKVEGRFQILAQDSAAYLPVTNYALRVDISGDVIDVYVDEERIFHVQDPDPIPQGSIALYSCGTDRAIFDFVNVWDLSAAPPFDPPVGALSFAELINEIPPGEWAKVNANRFDQVWTPLDQRPLAGTSLASPDRVISAWSSMAWDPNRGDLLFWGGGHANYAGNEVYRWRSANLLWERASLPSEIVFTGGSRYETIDGPFASPIAAHTYDSNEFLPLNDRFIVFGGAAFNDGLPFTNLIDGIHTRTGPYLWDPAKGDSTKVGGAAGSQVKPFVYPDVQPGHMWQNRDIQGWSFGSHSSVTAHTEESGKDVVYFQARTGDLLKYVVSDLLDPTQDRVTSVGRRWSLPTAQGVGAYSPDLNILLRTAVTSFAYWDLQRAGPTNRETIFTPQVSDARFFAQGANLYGMDYDPTRQRFTLWSGYGDVWHLTPPASLSPLGWIISPAPAPSGPVPTTGPGWGVLGKWKYLAGYDVFVGVTDSRSGDIWVYKPTDPLLRILIDALPNAELGTPYSRTLEAVDGRPPYSWAAAGDALPPGLTLSAEGMLSGIPNSAGHYDFSVSVADQGGSIASKILGVTVVAPNTVPVADFTFSCAGQDCNFIDGSTDSDGTIVAWSWNFGDGSSASTPSPSHRYIAGGTYPVTLTVTDNNGGTATASSNVLVIAPNAAPRADFGFTCNGLACSFTDNSSDIDGVIASRTWDFGDGASAVSSNPGHTYAADGTYTTRLTVVDNDGATATVSSPVTVQIVGSVLTDVILDDGDAGTASTGTWSNSSVAGGQDGDSLYGSGSGINTYRFTPTLGVPGQYRVYAWWTAHSNRSTRTSFRVGSATGVQTVEINQSVNGGRWNEIGAFEFAAGNTGYVEISDANGKYAIADAVRFEYVARIDTVQLTTTNLASGTVGTPYHESLTAIGGDPPYQWSIIAGGLPLGLSLAADGVISGSPTLPGSHNVTVEVRDSADALDSGTFSLPVVELPSPSDELVLDDGDIGTSSTGIWGVSAVGGGHDGDSLYGLGGGTNTYRYTPTFTSAGTYRLYAWWTAHSNRSPRAAFDVRSAAGLTTIEVDQRQNGGQWVELGTFQFDAASTGYVEISDRNGKYAIADAVRFLPTF